MNVAGIVLAAGASERMGQPKLLLPYRNGTILTATVDAFLAADLDTVIVVTGHGADEVERSIASLPVTVARNPDPDRGTMSSLLTGAAATDAGSFVYAPGDQPTISPDVIAALAATGRRDQPWAVVTRYRDRIAHPFLVSRAATDEFSSEHGDGVLWRGLVDSSDDRVDVAEVDRLAPVDVNTEADYRSLDGSAPAGVSVGSTAVLGFSASIRQAAHAGRARRT